MQLKVCLHLTISMLSRADPDVELDVGQLIKDPFFTLFESVGALEASKFCKVYGRSNS
jgi:hypothetical protein